MLKEGKKDNVSDSHQSSWKQDLLFLARRHCKNKRRQLSTTMSRTREQEGIHFGNWGTQLQFELGIEFLSLRVVKITILGKGQVTPWSFVNI